MKERIISPGTPLGISARVIPSSAAETRFPRSSPLVFRTIPSMRLSRGHEQYGGRKNIHKIEAVLGHAPESHSIAVSDGRVSRRDFKNSRPLWVSSPRKTEVSIPRLPSPLPQPIQPDSSKRQGEGWAAHSGRMVSKKIARKNRPQVRTLETENEHRPTATLSEKRLALSLPEKQQKMRRQLPTSPQAQRELQTIHKLRGAMRHLHPADQEQARTTYAALRALSRTNPAYTKQMALDSVLKGLEGKYKPASSIKKGSVLKTLSRMTQNNQTQKPTQATQETAIKKQPEQEKYVIDPETLLYRFKAVGMIFGLSKRASQAHLSGPQVASRLTREFKADPYYRSKVKKIQHDGSLRETVDAIARFPQADAITVTTQIHNHPPIMKDYKGQPATQQQIETVLRDRPLPAQATVYSYT